jgi:aspartate aminotransferase
MFFTMPQLHLDPLWRLSDDYAADPRSDRLNLIIGVYREDSGASEVMHSVREAEQRLAERAPSKEYISLSGVDAFNKAVTKLILGEDTLVARATATQAVGGTGALRLLAELLATTSPGRTVYLGTPAYVNHPAILGAANLNVVEYTLARNGELDARVLLQIARSAQAGDVLLIQGCCHNPTGLSMPDWLWDELAQVMAERGVIPFIDQAYFGLGDGMDKDLAGMRRLLSFVPEAVIAVSASKAWGLYSERTGCAIVVSNDPERRRYARGMLEVIGRAAYSQPPAHGALIVAEILGDPRLTDLWLAELNGMRRRLTALREGLVEELVAEPNGHAFDRLGVQRGMFLQLPLDPRQMDLLRKEHAVYGIPSGRINLAGVPSARIPELAASISAVAHHGSLGA